MRILVTGGAGFIGSNFVRHALAGAYEGFEDPQIVVLDKLTYAGTMDSLASVIHDPRLEFVHGDICDEDLVDRVMKDVALVLHFAAETHVDRSINSGVDFVRTNVVGTQTLLESARRGGVGKFVLVSTDEVYGSIERGSWVEDHPLEPNSPYSASKAAGDLLARAFSRTYGYPVSITRCSNNYGPFQFPEKVIPLFITNLLDGDTVPLYGDGLHVREWIHVDDHCRGIALVARHGRPNEVYNIGSEVELTNRELTETLLEIAQADWSRVRHVNDRKGHDRRYSVDSTKITTELGYRTQVDFMDGLRDTARWYAENRSWWEPLKKGDYPPVWEEASPV
ncbi:dTDP-glucose 4,6-dehydratase [Sinosporangium siamense]|uniref:dTDP-glucose 4,6-dehydratase n=1 Tax=Sinosporangium siamense TaxID=1367973 RepID=A0A919RE02_9ACTN|nr:dTDP-glucose 4,6-dehydratase [Sinosporangium siamense]GII90689.1 dTDP-glucose 4,6-dehydratase [Sinosporangium siamense]